MALLRQEMPANYCALTFDDGPGPYTAALLDLLADRGIVATFFVLGQNAERRPALIRRMLAEGHEVANHSYSHPDLRRLKPETQFQEMKKTLEVLHSLGAEVRYFRPPYGNYTPETAVKAESLGMTIMLWSMDSQDWKRHTPRLDGARNVSSATREAHPGMRGVLLFHDTHKNTVEKMPDILHALIVGGCERFVTVSDYMTKAPHEEEQRLSTEAPNGGRGEVPPLALALGMPGVADDGVRLWTPENRRSSWCSGTSMRTWVSHPVQGPSAVLRMQAAHGSPDGAVSAAVPKTPTTDLVTHRQPAPFPLARAIPQPQASAAVQGAFPRLISGPGMILPAHKINKGRQNMKQGEGDPG
jgi:peptidoglycan/xylan/chitin deacetylase (PgdA/CDA1 family)